MVSIVIPYLETVSSSNNSDELRYALRTWEKHALFNFEVILVGDRPKWFTGTVVECSPIRGIVFARAFDIANKLETICGTQEITDDFIYTYDDVYLVNDCTLKDFQQIISTGIVNKRRITAGGSRKWNQLFKDTINELFGLDRIYGYETHLPRMLNKQKLARLIEDFELRQNPLLFSTLYYNQYHDTPDVMLHDNNPLRVWAKATVRLKPSTKILNTFEGAWNKGAKHYFTKHYPNKSIYENV